MIATARTIPPPVRSVRRGIARLAAAGLGMALGATAPTAAVAADDWVAQLADGEPWSVRMPNGRTASMTLDPDGTG